MTLQHLVAMDAVAMDTVAMDMLLRICYSLGTHWVLIEAVGSLELVVPLPGVSCHLLHQFLQHLQCVCVCVCVCV